MVIMRVISIVFFLIFLISSLELASCALSFLPRDANRDGKGVIKIAFDVHRGNSFQDAAITKRHHLSKRSNSDGTVNATIVNEESYYMANLSIGSDSQNVGVLIDTGSSDLWVMSSSNPYCESSTTSDAVKEKLVKRLLAKRSPTKQKAITQDSGYFRDSNKFQLDTTSASFYNLEGKDDGGSGDTTETSISASPSATMDCDLYGTFDESKSDTFHSNGTDFLVQYADYTYASGTWAYDNVVIAGANVTDLSFAVANESNSSIGVLGIGFEQLETTYASSTTIESYTYANMPAKMVELGIIYKNAYSLYLNDSEATSGTILFGGVDHDKYTGSLETVEIVNTYASEGFTSPITLAVTLSSITVNGSTVTDTLAPALLDSGTTSFYAPANVMESLSEALGGTYSSDIGYYTRDCVSEDDDTQITLDFTGAKINASLYNLQVSISSSDDGYEDSSSSSTTSTCAIGIFDSGDDSYILGDSFLRSAYVVFDLDDYQISLAQANLNSTSEDIDVISSTVPSATTAPDYSSTWSATSGSNAYTTDDPLEGGGGISGEESTSYSTSETTETSGSGGSSKSSASKMASGTTIKVITAFFGFVCVALLLL
ncbi:hypothetical protein PACTADRAFT_51204 [Pachysolen tannophilus NRRL Y-2460]|uniref:candidapepsin n=1 Tax=Pachysolen tannophilus NRRL Y-2460 TaxID=669874 RepID=A0A1E4TRJ0_PACTA|nr:hypothetical protein PACTADRAFT_51204 [Pachysolen tannophilus NRRL Y-2460]